MERRSLTDKKAMQPHYSATARRSLAFYWNDLSLPLEDLNQCVGKLLLKDRLLFFLHKLV